MVGFQGVIAGTPVSFTGLSVPPSPVFLGLGVVFQGTTIDGAGALTLGNGIYVRIGSL